MIYKSTIKDGRRSANSLNQPKVTSHIVVHDDQNTNLSQKFESFNKSKVIVKNKTEFDEPDISKDNILNRAQSQNGRFSIERIGSMFKAPNGQKAITSVMNFF